MHADGLTHQERCEWPVSVIDSSDGGFLVGHSDDYQMTSGLPSSSQVDVFELECWLERSELDGDAHDDAPPLKEIVHLERSQSAVMLEQASATRLPRDCQCNEIATRLPRVVAPDCTFRTFIALDGA